TIPKILKQRGYVSAHMGKWHLGDDPENGPLAHGFDVNIGGNIAGHPKSYFSPYKNKNLSDGEKDEYLTDRLTGEALKFIDKNREKPFFLYLSHYAVHTPIQAKEEMTDKYRNKAPGKENDNPVYAAMIESVDDGVGKIVNKLQELELIDNTLIVFYSDNGGHGPTTSMEPLRGSKGMLYEGGIRVPLTVSWAGKIREDIKCDTPVTTTDMFPTFLDILSIDPSDHNMNLDGASLLPLLKEGGGFERDAIYWHFPAYLEAYRGAEGHWRTAPAGAVRAGKWKLIEFFETGRMELYNLEADIGENNDIADEYPDKVKELHDKLIKWREDTNAPVPTELNPDYTG
ncbi:MAG: sulfatase, partial [bacterium]|nr:sulfatase [bacterium]